MDWFRMYAEFASDPKVQSMSEAMQRRLMMLLCLRCSNTLVTLQDDEIAFALRISEDDLAETKALFVRKGFIGQGWEITNWDKRQFVSDSSAARVSRHRAKKKEEAKQASNVTVTPQIQNRTDTETEQIQNKTPSVPDGTGGAAAAVGDPPPTADPPKTPKDMTKQELWTAGKSLLVAAGMAPAQCGTFVGKLCKDYGDEVTLEAVRAAVVQRPADPASYLLAACRSRHGDPPDRRRVPRTENFDQVNYGEAGAI